MKKLTFILMAIFSMFAIASCGLGGEEEDKETRKFWVRDMTGTEDKFYQISAEKLAENSRCIIWAEKGSNVSKTTANNVANAYNNIYTKMMAAFGFDVPDFINGKTMNTMEIAHFYATGTTSNAKLTILLLDIKDGYKPGVNNSYVTGFFDAVNLNPNKNDPEYPMLKYSNELDMIYVDTYPATPDSDESNATLAHEMQHLMNIIASTVFRYDEGVDEIAEMELWINEGLSTAAEWLYRNGDPMKRIDWYNKNGNGKGINGEINVGNNFYVWDNRQNNLYANLDDYATAYLFFQYLRLQADNRDDIYFDIITSELSDYEAIINAESINSNHRDNWETLLRDWLAANYINESSGLYGYKGEITLNAPMFPNPVKTVSLYPGEGVYSKINGSSTASIPDPSGNIRYAGLNSTGTPVSSGGSASGARLTYNVNTNVAGRAVTGSTTGVASSVDISTPAGNASLQIASDYFTSPYAVDAGYILRKNQNYGVSNNIIRSVSGINSDENVEKSKKIFKVDRSKIKRVFINE